MPYFNNNPYQQSYNNPYQQSYAQNQQSYAPNSYAPPQMQMAQPTQSRSYERDYSRERGYSGHEHSDIDRFKHMMQDAVNQL